MNVVLSLMMFVSVGFAQNFKNLDVSSMKQADIGKLPLPNEDRKYVFVKIIDGFILVGVNERDNNNNNSQKNENKFSLKTQFLLKDDDELKKLQNLTRGGIDLNGFTILLFDVYQVIGRKTVGTDNLNVIKVVQKVRK
jgi:hypothetical protein